MEKGLKVVDLTASVLAMENKLPMRVFGLDEANGIVNAVFGDFSGTEITV